LILLFFPYFVYIQINVICCTCLFYEIYPHYITNTHIVSPVLHVEAIYIWHMFKSHWDVSIYFDFVYTSSAYIIIVISTCAYRPFHYITFPKMIFHLEPESTVLLHMNNKNKSFLGYPVEINPSIRSIFVFAHASRQWRPYLCSQVCREIIWNFKTSNFFNTLWYGLYESRSFAYLLHLRRSVSVWTQPL